MNFGSELLTNLQWSEKLYQSCIIWFRNTLKLIKKTRLRLEFSTHFFVFGNRMKHFSSCKICEISNNSWKKEGVMSVANPVGWLAVQFHEQSRKHQFVHLFREVMNIFIIYQRIFQTSYKFRRDSVDDFYLIAVREKIYGRPCLLLSENVLRRPTVTFFNCKGILKSCIVLKQKEFSIISAKFFIVPQSQWKIGEFGRTLGLRMSLLVVKGNGVSKHYEDIISVLSLLALLPKSLSWTVLELLNNSWRENKGNFYRKGGLELRDLNHHKIWWTLALNCWRICNGLRSYIKAVSFDFETPWSWLKKTRLRLEFSTHFFVFGNRMKHFSSCKICEISNNSWSKEGVMRVDELWLWIAQEFAMVWEAISKLYHLISKPWSWLKKLGCASFFSTHFFVFGNRMKHFSSCLIYYLKLVCQGSVKSKAFFIQMSVIYDAIETRHISEA